MRKGGAPQQKIEKKRKHQKSPGTSVPQAMNWARGETLLKKKKVTSEKKGRGGRGKKERYWHGVRREGRKGGVDFRKKKRKKPKKNCRKKKGPKPEKEPGDNQRKVQDLEKQAQTSNTG